MEKRLISFTCRTLFQEMWTISRVSLKVVISLPPRRWEQTEEANVNAALLQLIKLLSILQQGTRLSELIPDILLIT